MTPSFCSVLAGLILLALPAAADPAPGITHLTDTSRAERPLALSVWYPSGESASVVFGGNAVFEGVAVVPNAVPPTVPLPLVVVSHGGLRSADDTGAWLSASIAQRGFIVVEVNAPRPNDAATALSEIWQRPDDISRAIDRILADYDWNHRIDRTRISVVGFALGGTAALSIAGAEMDIEAYMQSCASGRPPQAPDCEWLTAQGVSLAQTSLPDLGRPKRDPRVTSVVAVNPEYPGALSAPFQGVAILHISLGQNPLEEEQTVTIPQSSVFDAFAICSARGKAILLEEEGDGSLCNTAAEARQYIHSEILRQIGTFLAHGL
jgi:predicted dienelactone hydrolase